MAMPLATADLERWAPQARALPSIERLKTSVPFLVLLDEAIELAAAYERHWDAIVEAGQVVRPGLSSVAGKGLGSLLHAGLGEELRSLQRACSDANTNYELVTKLGGSPTERGQRLLSELRGAIEFLLGGRTDTEDAARVAALASAHAVRPNTQAELALAIDAYAAFAELHRAELDGLGGFSAARIDEAPALARELRERTRTPVAVTTESVGARDLRDRYVALLVDRMNAVRASARFVFRDHPGVVRLFTSEYERRRRNASRRAGSDEVGDETELATAEAEVAES